MSATVELARTHARITVELEVRVFVIRGRQHTSHRHVNVLVRVWHLRILPRELAEGCGHEVRRIAIPVTRMSLNTEICRSAA